MIESPRERAEATLSAIVVYEDALAAENRKPVSQRDFAYVSQLISRINRASRVAGVWAQLATADAITHAALPVADVAFPDPAPAAEVAGFNRLTRCACGAVTITGDDELAYDSRGMLHGSGVCAMGPEAGR